MKKNILTLSFVFFTLMQVFASKNNHPNFKHYYGNEGSFNFMENNVHFMVYQNGEFDFFIQRPNMQIGVNFGNVNITFNSGYDYDDYVLYDDYGAIIQIEDIPIYYDYYGRISRIGNTSIRYQNRRLIQFGAMYVYYNNYGYYDHCSGYVNRFNRSYNYRPYVSYFARPIYTQCIVSYEPYRRYYRPVRYRYNSTEFRRRARNNSYYRSNSTRVVRRKSIPRRVASKNRKDTRVVRRSNTTPSRNVHRTNHAIRTRGNSGTRNIGSRRTVSTTRNNHQNSIRTRGNSVTRRTQPTRGHSTRNTASNHRNNTINHRVNRSNNSVKRNTSSIKRNTSLKRANTNRSSKRMVAKTSGHRRGRR